MVSEKDASARYLKYILALAVIILIVGVLTFINTGGLNAPSGGGYYVWAGSDYVWVEDTSEPTSEPSIIPSEPPVAEPTASPACSADNCGACTSSQCGKNGAGASCCVQRDSRSCILPGTRTQFCGGPTKPCSDYTQMSACSKNTSCYVSCN